MIKNPILKREIMLAARSVKSSVVLFIVNCLILFIVLLQAYAFDDGVKINNKIQYELFVELYILLASIEFIVVMLIVPGLLSGTIAGEREMQTLDILLTTKLKPIDIIFGKIFSALYSISIIVISTAPLLSMGFVFGGLQIYDLLLLFVCILLGAVLAGSMSIYFSALVRKTVIATVTAYIGLLALVGLPFLINIGANYFQGMIYNSYERVYGVGGYIYILLLNPVVTFYGLINEQVGNPNAIINLCNLFGVYETNFVIENWTIIGILLLLLMSYIFIKLAVNDLNPLSKKKKLVKRQRD